MFFIPFWFKILLNLLFLSFLIIMARPLAAKLVDHITVRRILLTNQFYLINYIFIIIGLVFSYNFFETSRLIEYIIFIISFLLVLLIYIHGTFRLFYLMKDYLEEQSLFAEVFKITIFLILIFNFFCLVFLATIYGKLVYNIDFIVFSDAFFDFFAIPTELTSPVLMATKQY